MGFAVGSLITSGGLLSINNAYNYQINPLPQADSTRWYVYSFTGTFAAGLDQQAATHGEGMYQLHVYTLSGPTRCVVTVRRLEGGSWNWKSPTLFSYNTSRLYGNILKPSRVPLPGEKLGINDGTVSKYYYTLNWHVNAYITAIYLNSNRVARR